MSSIPTSVPKGGAAKPKEIPATTLMRNEIHELEEVLKASRQEEDSGRQRMELTIQENEALTKERAKIWAGTVKQLEGIKADRDSLLAALAAATKQTEIMEAEVLAMTREAELQADTVETHMVECQAPSGQVTIVFTDIEDSTNHWEWNYDVMKVALDLHNSIMRNHSLLLQGYEVRTEGDAFMIAFQDPMDAVQWCLSVQLALLHAEWPEKLFEFPASKIVRNQSGDLLFRGCRVRMGAHTGTPELDVDPHSGRTGYFGSMAHRAHNVAAAGHGGQILVSGLTWELIKDRLDELGNPFYEDMGFHRLPDMATDERLFSMVPIEVKERSFPIPRSARPPTELILKFIGDLEGQSNNLETLLRAAEGNIDLMIQEGETLLGSISAIMASFSRWQKRQLLDEDIKLTDLIERKEEARAALEAFWILERNAKRGMDAMDGVLNSVSKQLDIVPKLEGRIRQLRQELKVLKAAHQKERAGYVEDLANIHQYLGLFNTAFKNASVLIEDVKTWSNRDQLNLNDDN
jgi:class 3 adenylate cyclase